MLSSFDPTKPVRTRDGRKARIICTDKLSMVATGVPIVALVELRSGGEEAVYIYESGGRCFNRPSEDNDLVNYDPFEITDTEAELMIEYNRLWYLNEVERCKLAEKYILDRDWVKSKRSFPVSIIRLRDAIIATREKKNA